MLTISTLRIFLRAKKKQNGNRGKKHEEKEAKNGRKKQLKSRKLESKK